MAANLVTPRNIQRAGSIGREIQTAAADAFAAAMLPVLRAIRNAAADTLEVISCPLNQRENPISLRGPIIT